MLFIKGCNNNKVKPKTINKTDPVIVDSLSINLNQDVPKIEDFVNKELCEIGSCSSSLLLLTFSLLCK